jgi:type VI secretion system secreted protein Hcp
MKLIPTCLVALTLCLPLKARAQVQPHVIIVLKLDGIDGQSVVPGHANEIDLLGVGFSCVQTGAVKDATGKGGASKSVLSPMKIQKASDSASPKLFLGSAIGGVSKNAKITFIRTDGATNFEFLTFALTNVFISQYELGASDGDSNAGESVSLNFTTIKVIYDPGNGLTPIGAGFDLIKNTALPVTVGSP